MSNIQAVCTHSIAVVYIYISKLLSFNYISFKIFHFAYAKHIQNYKGKYIQHLYLYYTLRYRCYRITIVNYQHILLYLHLYQKLT